MLGSISSLIIIVSLFLRPTVQIRKMWIASDKLNDPNMWSPAKIPCQQDIVVLPKRLPYGISVSAQDVRIREIRLPEDGSVLIDELVLVDDPTPNCPGEIVTYKRNVLHAWADPGNWLAEKTLNEIEMYSGEALPDLYKLPCMTDTVLFTPYFSPMSRLPTVRQLITGISINEKNYTTAEWETVEMGFENFPSDNIVPSDLPLVKIVDYDYFANYENGDLPCQENAPDEMCDYVNCNFPKCLHPVKPYHHCCDMCGAVITVGSVESLLKVRVIVLEKLAGNTDVDLWVGVIARKHLTQNTLPTIYNKKWLASTQNFYQVVLVDSGVYDEVSTKIARTLVEVLKKELNLIDGGEVFLSGLPWEGSSAAPGGWEALIMLLIVLAVLFALVLYYYPPSSVTTSNYSPFTFAKFENRSREGSLIQGISQLSLNKEFDNPMYRAQDVDDDMETIAEDIGEDSDVIEVELEAPRRDDVGEGKEKDEQETSFVKTSMSELLVKDEDGSY